MKISNGSLTKREKRGKNVWEVAFEIESDPSSDKRKRVYYTVIATSKKAAEREKARLRAELEAELNLTSRQTTLSVYMKEYLEGRKALQNIEPSTLYGYEKYNQNYIEPHLGNMLLAELNMESINKWQKKLVTSGGRHNGPLSAVTVGACLRLLKMALDSACAMDILVRNPCAFVKPPKKQRKEPNALDKSEISRLLTLLDGMEHTQLTIAIRLALATGLRRGELTALTWANIDLDDLAPAINVTQAFGVADGNSYIKEPKNKSSIRTVPLDNDTAKHLKAWKNQQAEDLLSHGIRSDKKTFVLANETDKPYLPDKLSKDFAVIAKAYKFSISFHDLRHTHATYLIARGVDVKTVSSRLGHANAAMTLNVYASADKEAARSAAKIVESVMTEKDTSNGRLISL